MSIDQVLHMNGGVGETSYASNRFMQRKAIANTMPITKTVIRELCLSKLPRTLAIADLGCSSGPNTLLVISEVIKHVQKICREQRLESPEYQIFLNDLPETDFNTIFKSLGSFKKKLGDEMVDKVGSCYFNGVPGTFYGRIFPSKSIHFVHSSYSVHWLSQVPKGIENKGNIYISRTSPPNVVKAYYNQFQRDFSLFLKCRAEELVEGGCMVLTLLGRRSDDPCSKDCCHLWDLMASALNDMVFQGLITEEEVDSINIPNYLPSLSEVKHEVLKEGSFRINQLQVFQVNWKGYNVDEISQPKADDGGYNFAKCVRRVTEPLIAAHFGESVVAEIFRRYEDLIADSMSKEENELVNVTVSVTKKA